MSKDEIYKVENEALIERLQELNGFIESEETALSNLYKRYEEDIKEASQEKKRDDVIESMGIAIKAMGRKGYRQRKEYLEKLTKILHNPYFSRIDVHLYKDNSTETHYIGKMGFSGYKKNLGITDWRAPIASLYYNFAFATKHVSFDRTAFNALDKDETLNCDLDIRRTIEVENQKIINIYDDSLIDNISKDAFLLSKLEAKKGGGLEDIIETIQSDQNKIIRHSPFENILVQGVAGSGKTTIAIHRISYIFYNFKDKILPSETLFLSTSKVLINYLSKSLPELDIYNIKKASLLEYLKELLDQNKIKLQKKISAQLTKDIIFYDIHYFLKCLEQFILKLSQDAKINFEITILADRDSLEFKNIIRIYDRFSQRPIFDKILILLTEVKEELREVKKEIRYEGKSDYLERRVRTLGYLEKNIISFLGDFKLEEKYLSFLKQNFNFEPNTYDENHLSAIYLVCYKLGFLPNREDYNLVLLDEAQDLNSLSYMCVKTFSTKNCFNFFGDLNQSISKKTAIKDWSEVIEIFSDSTKTFNLQISFRSTRQIIDRAKKELIKAGITQNLPQPVSRDGLIPTEQQFKNLNEALEYITKEIKSIRAKELKSIGIILTNDLDAESVTKKLKNPNLEHELITQFFDNFKKDSVYVVPLNLVKGLEFDSVFFLNINALELKDKIEGAFKSFVAISRAMSKVYLLGFPINKTSTFN
ncbi:MAG: UvrD-helicase domain-containing protein [Patescibacteria group bacterium]